MKFNELTYLQYTPSQLHKKKSLGNKLKQYRWEVIIPFVFIIISILIVASMQLPKPLA